MKRHLWITLTVLLVAATAWAASPLMEWHAAVNAKRNSAAPTCETVALDVSGVESVAITEFSRYHENGASKFMAGDWGPVCGVAVWLKDAGTSTQTLQFIIKTDDAGVPGDVVGSASATVGGAEVGATETKITLSMDTGQLTNGNSYWLCGTADSEQGTDYLTVVTTDGTTEVIMTADTDTMPLDSSEIRSTYKTWKFQILTQ